MALRELPEEAEPIDHFGAVGARLRSPAESVDLATFAARLRQRAVRIRVAGEAETAADPRFIGRLRGAIGDRLAEAASPEAIAGEPCPWQPPCAFEVMFRKQGRLSSSPSVEFAAPLLLSTEADGRDLAVSLTLFGFATEWMPAAAEVLGAVLAKRLDFAYTRRGSGLGAPRLIERRLIAGDGLELSGARFSGFDLDFVSPLAGDHASPAALISGARHRLEGIARWHDLTLGETDWPAITAAAHRLTWCWTSRRRIAWQRSSRRQNQTLSLSGTIGRLSVLGPADDLAIVYPALALGAATRLGADIAFGCGRYLLTPLKAAPGVAKPLGNRSWL